MRSHESREPMADKVPQLSNAIVPAEINDLMGLRRHPFQPVDHVRGVRSRACERQVVARATVKHADAIARRRGVSEGIGMFWVEDVLQVLFELRPVPLVELL